MSTKRTKLSDRILPSYTKGEEIFNMTSHIVGGVLGIVATVLCVIFAAIHNNSYGVVSGAIYGSTLIILYTMSSIYHGLSPRLFSKKVFQVLDHCTIFLLIAGCYTPIALCNIRVINPMGGWTIFGIIWGLAIIGIIFNSIDLKKFKTFSMICYLLMGWCIIFRADLLLKSMDITGVILLVLGGISYTIGSVLYGIGKKHKYIHSIFHLFILFGSFLQFFCILLFSM